MVLSNLIICVFISDEDEFNRWMKNAKTTLISAEIDNSSKFYNWAFFKAQQASEYAIKAYLRGTGKSSFGHSIALLLKDLDFDTNLIDLAKKIDKYYIPIVFIVSSFKKLSGPF